MMPEKYRKVFANKQIVCVEYHEISEEDEREVFQVRSNNFFLNPSYTFTFVESSTWYGSHTRR